MYTKISFLQYTSLLFNFVTANSEKIKMFNAGNICIILSATCWRVVPAIKASSINQCVGKRTSLTYKFIKTVFSMAVYHNAFMLSPVVLCPNCLIFNS